MSAAAPPLAKLQQQFQDYVLRGADGVAGVVKSDARGDAAMRLDVYADAYRLRLLEVLGRDYEALQRFLGPKAFERLGRVYIQAHPSDTPSVRWFGRHLPEFLCTAPAYAARPVLGELALFEWKKGEVFDAPEAEPLPLEEIAAVPPQDWPRMHLLLHPSLRRLNLRWNVPAICQAYDRGDKTPRTRAKGQALPWLMWRDAELNISWRPLEADEAAALDAVSAGRSFGELCELLCRWVEPEEAAMHAAGLLKRWVIDRLVVGVEVSG
jgi:hypothetical protein